MIRNTDYDSLQNQNLDTMIVPSQNLQHNAMSALKISLNIKLSLIILGK